MNPVVEVRPRDPFRVRERRRRVARVVGMLAVAAFLFTVAGRLFDDPERVARLRFDNPSEYDIHVAVTASPDGGLLPLGVAVQRCSTDFHEVIDVGPTWIVRFATQGEDAGAMTLDRDQVVRDGWTIRIPDDVVSGLRASGVPAPPVHRCAS